MAPRTMKVWDTRWRREVLINEVDYNPERHQTARGVGVDVVAGGGQVAAPAPVPEPPPIVEAPPVVLPPVVEVPVQLPPVAAPSITDITPHLRPLRPRGRPRRVRA